MDKQTEIEIREHFLEWSGGFPPDGKDTVYIYVTAVGRVGVSDHDLTRMLYRWMEGEYRL